jgi:Mg-chelatase subunit ChlD
MMAQASAGREAGLCSAAMRLSALVATLSVVACSSGTPTPSAPSGDCSPLKGASVIRLLGQGSHALARTDLRADLVKGRLTGESFALTGTNPRPVRVDRALSDGEKAALHRRLDTLCVDPEATEQTEMATGGFTYFEVVAQGATTVLARDGAALTLAEGRQRAEVPVDIFADLLVAFPIDKRGELVSNGEPAPVESVPTEVRAQIETAPAPPTKLRPCRTGSQTGYAVVLVLDRSGSMSGERIEAARSGVVEVIGALTAIDRLGVVVFDSRAEPLVRLAPLGDGGLARQAVARLQPGGGTDGEPALEMAYEALREAPERVRHVVFMTDGQMPVRGLSELAAQMSSCAISLSTIGLGKDVDSELLSRLAADAGGTFVQMRDPTGLPKALTDEVERARNR